MMPTDTGLFVPLPNCKPHLLHIHAYNIFTPYGMSAPLSFGPPFRKDRLSPFRLQQVFDWETPPLLKCRRNSASQAAASYEALSIQHSCDCFACWHSNAFGHRFRPSRRRLAFRPAYASMPTTSSTCLSVVS